MLPQAALSVYIKLEAALALGSALFQLAACTFACVVVIDNTLRCCDASEFCVRLSSVLAIAKGRENGWGSGARQFRRGFRELGPAG